MKCQECLFEFDKPAQADDGFPGGDTWPICPHCRAVLPDKYTGRATKRDYERVNKNWTELPENNKSVSLFKGLVTGAEFALEVKFRELLGDKVFLELVRVSRGGI